MPTTINNIADKIYNFENLESAVHAVGKGKSMHGEYLAFMANYEENIITLQNELIWKTYVPGKCSKFVVFEPKRREITAPRIRDRIVHHALVQIIEPLLNREFSERSYACRVGKGGLRACQMLQHDIRGMMATTGNKFNVVDIDIHKFFASIPHSILKYLIRRYIRDQWTLWLIDLVVDSFDGETGQAIGFLTSQLFANMVLDTVDHLVMDIFGITRYVRYMDDCRILFPSHHEAMAMLEIIDTFTHDRLHISLNVRKTKEYRFDDRRGILFCGFLVHSQELDLTGSCISRTIRRLKKKIALYEIKQIPKEKVIDSYVSFLGHAKFARWSPQCQHVADLYWKEAVHF
jgi:retron-type reverse transcriptase